MKYRNPQISTKKFHKLIAYRFKKGTKESE